MYAYQIVLLLFSPVFVIAAYYITCLTILEVLARSVGVRHTRYCKALEFDTDKGLGPIELLRITKRGVIYRLTYSNYCDVDGCGNERLHGGQSQFCEDHS